MGKSFFKMAALSMGALVVSCAMEPKVKELDKNSDPQIEVGKLDSQIRNGEQEQQDLLAPKSFAAAKKFRDKAVLGRSENRAQKTILHDVAVSQSYLDKARETSGISRKWLQEVIAARQFALEGGANTEFPKELASIDKQLVDMTEDIESNDTSDVESGRKAIENKYRDLERTSIKSKKLASAYNTIEAAKGEGAAKLTPETLVWAERRLREDSANIDANLRNADQVNAAANDATEAANRLLKMVRTAKNSKSMNAEDFAKRMESDELILSQANSKLKSANSNLTDSKEKLASEEGRNDELQSQVWLDNKYEAARKQFSKNEAEVYKQGNKLLLRLKGLSFSNNQSTIQTTNFPLMAKVQKVIAEVSPTEVTIEGHTDSTGGKKLNLELSTLRAQAVQSYLVSNKTIPEDRVSATGLGDSKPIATNKTSVGRSQNRRVDVILSAGSETSINETR